MARQEERAVPIALDALEPGAALEGIFVAGSRRFAPGAVIAAPHPLYGGSMESPVVTELAYAASRAGVASLRFNWRGVGASAGTSSGAPADADSDYEAALRHLAETVPGRLVACGYSFGAAAALRAAARHPRVASLVLVAPPPALSDPAAVEAFEGPILVLAGEYDTIAPVAAVQELVGAHGDAQVVVVPDADHFFGAGLPAIRRTATDWLAERADAPGAG